MGCCTNKYENKLGNLIKLSDQEKRMANAENNSFFASINFKSLKQACFQISQNGSLNQN
jgi:hypothetical protein